MTGSIPENPGTVYLRGLGSEGYVDRSLDGGLTWERLITGSSDIVIAPGGVLYSVSGLTLLRSRDAGATWETVGSLPDYRISLVVDPRDAEKLYLATGFNGLWRSADHGATWKPSTAGVAERGDFVYTFLFAHPSSPHTFFALPMNGGIFAARFNETE